MRPFFGCICNRIIHYRLRKREGFTISKNDLQINEEIRDNEVRVVSEDGEQLGVMSAAAAMDIAEDKGLD